MSQLAADQFKKRLTVLCLNPGGRGLPRKATDRHILLKSVTLLMGNHDYTEKELNRLLCKWLEHVGRNLDLDHVSLRRELVDIGYVDRDSRGSVYRAGSLKTVISFDASIDELDPIELVNTARAAKDERKRQYLQSHS